VPAAQAGEFCPTFSTVKAFGFTRGEVLELGPDGDRGAFWHPQSRAGRTAGAGFLPAQCRNRTPGALTGAMRAPCAVAAGGADLGFEGFG